MLRAKILEQQKWGRAPPRIDNVQWGRLMCRKTRLPLVPGGSQSIRLLSIDNYVDSSYLRRNRTRIGHSLFGREIQFSNWDNEPVTYVLWMERNSSDTFTLNVLVMVADTCKQQHQQWDERHDDPGPFQKLHRGHDQCDQASSESAHS